MSEDAASPAPGRHFPLWQRVGLLGFAATIIAFALGQLAYFKNFESMTLDMRFRLRPVDAETISTNLLFVGITDYDLQEHGHWPWPRDLLAQMLSVFTNSTTSPCAIGYDVVFDAPRPDRGMSRDEKRATGIPKGRKAAAKLETPGLTYQEDALFGKVLAQLENVCLPGMIRRESSTKQSRSDLDAASLQWLQTQVFPSDVPIKPVSEIVLPAPAFRKGTHFAVLNAGRDKDGVARRMPIFVKEGDHWIPSLAFRMFMIFHTIHPDETTLERGKSVRVSSPGLNLEIPVIENPRTGDQEIWVNYRGQLKDFQALPFQAVLDGLDPRNRDGDLQRKLQSADGGLVVIGFTGTGMDVGPIPLHANAPLVTVQVNALNNLIQEDFLRTTTPAGVFLITLAFSTLIGWSTLQLSAQRGALVLAGVLILFLSFIWFCFTGASLWIPFIVPSTGLLLAYTGGTVLRFTGEERQKRELRRAFQNYLSANIMEEVLKNPASMQLGGDLKEITVLFTDVRGFTSFCEQNRADPQKVVAVLNEVLGVISEIVIKHDGTLDKYIGDCVMAFWGAPTPGKKHHAHQAVEAAFEMRHVLARCRKEWEARGLPVLYLGVGINTGSMVVGNIGSQRLRNYTLIGHEVNMGARLESQTRQFDTDIILSQATVDRLGPNFKTRYLAEVQVKGAEQPLKIYALEGIES